MKHSLLSFLLAACSAAPGQVGTDRLPVAGFGGSGEAGAVSVTAGEGGGPDGAAGAGESGGHAGAAVGGVFGGGAGADGQAGAACQPRARAAACGSQCGTVDDGCSGQIDCGGCPTQDVDGRAVPQSCVGNVCRVTCQDVGAQCGTVASLGLQCGSCPGSGGACGLQTPNQCTYCRDNGPAPRAVCPFPGDYDVWSFCDGNELTAGCVQAPNLSNQWCCPHA